MTLELGKNEAQVLMQVLSQTPTGYELYPIYMRLRVELEKDSVPFTVIKNTEDEQEEE
jgi:hypothetical protein